MLLYNYTDFNVHLDLVYPWFRSFLFTWVGPFCDLVCLQFIAIILSVLKYFNVLTLYHLILHKCFFLYLYLSIKCKTHILLSHLWTHVKCCFCFAFLTWLFFTVCNAPSYCGSESLKCCIVPKYNCIYHVSQKNPVSPGVYVKVCVDGKGFLSSLLCGQTGRLSETFVPQKWPNAGVWFGKVCPSETFVKCVKFSV